MGFKPTDEDAAIWSHTVKDSEKLSGAQKTSKSLSDIKIKSQQKKTPLKQMLKEGTSIPVTLAQEPPSSTLKPYETMIAAHPPQLNRRDESRLRRGKIEIEGAIDLHGLTQARAHIALTRYIQDAVISKKRCILVITGKGSISKPSVLKQKLPEWLNDPAIAPNILRHTHAQPKDGGTGAFYIYLKRQKA